MDPVLRAGHGYHYYNWLQLLLEHQKSIRNRVKWTQCGCGSWIHADCISKIHVEENGKPRTCYLA